MSNERRGIPPGAEGWKPGRSVGDEADEAWEEAKVITSSPEAMTGASERKNPPGTELHQPLDLTTPEAKEMIAKAQAARDDHERTQKGVSEVDPGVVTDLSPKGKNAGMLDRNDPRIVAALGELDVDAVRRQRAEEKAAAERARHLAKQREPSVVVGRQGGDDVNPTIAVEFPDGVRRDRASAQHAGRIDLNTPEAQAMFAEARRQQAEREQAREQAKNPPNKKGFFGKIIDGIFGRKK